MRLYRRAGPYVYYQYSILRGIHDLWTMKMLLSVRFVTLLTTLALVIQAQAQDQSGFISIDCGTESNLRYTEENTGINYTSDENFIDTGECKSVEGMSKTKYQRQMWTVRSFPQGARNCYTVNITSGSKYLIRAAFLYGNYDGLNMLPKFDIHLGPNLWDTVEIQNATNELSFEIIHVATTDQIQICLINTNHGTPFISALGFRPLKDYTYMTQSGSLSLFHRWDIGSTTNKTYRYSDDIFDRCWHPPRSSISEWTQLSGSCSADTLTLRNYYQPPAPVMNTAAVPINSSSPLNFYWTPLNPSFQFYIYMYFAEIEMLAENETRSFDIYVNGNHWYGPFRPLYCSTTVLWSQSATSGSNISFSLHKSESASLPPILNAIEIYTVKEFTQRETQQGDVDAITNIKSNYGIARNWQGDPCAPVSYKWDGLNCNYSQVNPRIISLNLSSSGLKGDIFQIASHITMMSMLQYLDLSDNDLTGTLPDFLAELHSLKVLKISNNNLTGSVPNNLMESSENGVLSLSMEGNPNLCATDQCQKNINGHQKKVVVLIAISVGGFMAIIAATVVFCIKVKTSRDWKKPQEGEFQNPSRMEAGEEFRNSNGISLESIRREYTFSDLIRMTNDFQRILGKGGFGTVYHGYIDDIQVAVKTLSQSAVQGYRQFHAEVKLLLRVHHRNLTPLVGYCNEQTHLGLIYEYMANGTLAQHLRGNDSHSKFLSWMDRIKISLDSAQGLEYLHNGCRPPIIHRDVKSTNILLNEHFQAKLADFGLSRIFPSDGDTHVSTIVAGTPGYLDPEYYKSNRLTEKSDVYSFGVVLLEIITGRPVISRNHEKSNIVKWVGFMVDRGDMNSIVDSRLVGEYETSSVWRAVEIAMDCVSDNPSKRPNMSDVVVGLKECLAIELAQRRSNNAGELSDSIGLLPINLAHDEVIPVAR